MFLRVASKVSSKKRKTKRWQAGERSAAGWGFCSRANGDVALLLLGFVWRAGGVGNADLARFLFPF